MKRTVIILIILMLPLGAFAQSNAIEKFRNKYQQDRDATSVTISGSLFQLISQIAELSDEYDEDIEALTKLTAKVKSMHILSIPMHYTGLNQEEIKSLKNDLLAEKYEELISIKDDNKTMNFYATGSETQLKNMLVLIDEVNNFTILNVDGDLDLKELSKLAKNYHNFH